jgi:hypothetical protein
MISTNVFSPRVVCEFAVSAETMQAEENEQQLARVASLTALARGCGRRGPGCPLVLVSVATCAEVSVHP